MSMWPANRLSNFVITGASLCPAVDGRRCSALLGPMAESRARGTGKSSRGPGPGSRGFDLTIAHRRLGDKGIQQPAHDVRHLVNGPRESLPIRLGWPREAAYLSHELQGCRSDLLLGGRWLKIVQSLDAST